MKSVAAKLKTICGVQASYFHCLAHCNELIVKDAHEISSMLSDSLGICQTLYALIGAYPKRIALLEGIQKDAQYEVESEDYKILRLRSLSVTRWTTRAKAAYVVLMKNKELKVALSTLAKDSTTTGSSKDKRNLAAASMFTENVWPTSYLRVSRAAGKFISAASVCWVDS